MNRNFNNDSLKKRDRRAISENKVKDEKAVNLYDKSHLETAMNDNLKHEFLSCWKKGLWFPYRNQECEAAGNDFFVAAYPDGREELIRVSTSGEDILINHERHLSGAGEGKYAYLLKEVQNYQPKDSYNLVDDVQIRKNEGEKTFTMIIGPAGSGKGIHGKSCCPSSVLDLDYMEYFYSKHHGYDDRLAQKEANKYYGQWIEAYAYHNGDDIALEVRNNYEDPFSEAFEFRELGYQVEAYFFGIDTVQESMIRSFHGHANEKGGEYYPVVVEKDFKNCYESAVKAINNSAFDEITFIDNRALDNVKIVAVFDSKEKNLTVYDQDVKWFEERFHKQLDKLIEKNNGLDLSI